MSESDQSRAVVDVSAVPSDHRAWMRVGFALCSAACALALGFLLVSFGAAQLASSAESEVLETQDANFKLASHVASAAIDALLIAGVACLYAARNSARWRRVSAAALVLLGMDVAVVSYGVVGADQAALELIMNLGMTLNWGVFWMLATLAADAAESIERPDITHQTEATGRLIICGAVAWLAYLIWSFDPAMLGADGKRVAVDQFSLVLWFAALILQLFSLGRIMFFGGSLAAALSSNQDAAPPVQPAG
jgi:hypothetical protein